MATMITDECINCGACEPECPNTAIYQGGIEFDGTDGSKHGALSDDFFYIVPEKCTECVGFFDQEACAAVCPVDCCIPNPDIPEAEDVLFARAKELHPGESFPDDFPSRFKEGAGGGNDAAGDAAAAPAAGGGSGAPAAAPAGGAVAVMSAEDAVGARVPLLDDWEVPLTCFRCTRPFEVPFQFTRPGTVLHCPYCGGSFVPNTKVYQQIATRVEQFYESWKSSFDELKTRRARELKRFEDKQMEGLDKLKEDVRRMTGEVELAGAPQRTRGIFG